MATKAAELWRCIPDRHRLHPQQSEMQQRILSQPGDHVQRSTYPFASATSGTVNTKNLFSSLTLSVLGTVEVSWHTDTVFAQTPRVVRFSRARISRMAKPRTRIAAAPITQAKQTLSSPQAATKRASRVLPIRALQLRTRRRRRTAYHSSTRSKATVEGLDSRGPGGGTSSITTSAGHRVARSSESWEDIQAARRREEARRHAEAARIQREQLERGYKEDMRGLQACIVALRHECEGRSRGCGRSGSEPARSSGARWWAKKTTR
ncbi:hypothetical protein BC826DRAFT_322131 [Russula brevipes]|nr:hypothetical protein BC826DRAFT_322131 [Russula brevipes]